MILPLQSANSALELQTRLKLILHSQFSHSGGFGFCSICLSQSKDRQLEKLALNSEGRCNEVESYIMILRRPCVDRDLYVLV